MRWLDGITYSRHGFEQALESGEGQGSLACCSSWGRSTEYLTKIISQVPAWPKVAFSKFPEAQSMHCLDPPLEIKFPLP